MTFRKKIILAQVILFILFFVALFPFVDNIASLLVRDSLIKSTTDLKKQLEFVKSEEEMIDLLKNQRYYSFFRMSIINDHGLVIYDTYLSTLLGNKFTPYYPTEHHEIQDALKEGKGYIIAPSDTFGVQFAYVAERFSFENKTYVLRTSFPYEQIQDLTKSFEIGILIFTFLILLCFNSLIWIIFNRQTSPIIEIIDLIKPYQTGVEAALPEIKLSRTTGPKDEFQRLASAFNSLSKKIEDQIQSLKEERNEKEAILESLGEGVIAVDRHMHVLYINSTAAKMLGLSRHEVLSHHLIGQGEKVNHLLLQKCIELLEDSQKKGIPLTDSLVFGKERKTYIDLIAAPKTQGAIIVLQDKTNHYRVLEMGKDFVANASHELRTPITIIKGFAETLHDMPKMSHDLLKEITEKIGRNCVRMENLVNNLLILADIENLPEERFHPSDLISLIENCRHTLQLVHPEAEITIEKTQESIPINADSGLLELAFNNLLDNAVKYSKAPANVHVIIKSHGKEVLIQIIDKGVGIPPEDLDYIFERFYRVDKTHSRRLGGAGLGLSIVKTIITKHHGSITVTSKVGKGTTFTITLPIQK